MILSGSVSENLAETGVSLLFSERRDLSVRWFHRLWNPILTFVDRDSARLCGQVHEKCLQLLFPWRFGPLGRQKLHFHFGPAHNWLRFRDGHVVALLPVPIDVYGSLIPRFPTTACHIGLVARHLLFAKFSRGYLNFGPFPWKGLMPH